MEKDFRLEEIFDAHRPDLGDGAKFMATLQHRLEAAEYLRAMREAERRHCRRMMLAALLAGLVVGGTLVAVLQQMPHDTPLPARIAPGLSAGLSREGARLACTVLASALLGGLVIAVIHLLGMEQGTPLPHPMKKG